MQTFLPYSSFYRSAACLDRQRLGAMRRESKAILTYLRLIREGDMRFVNQPVVRQWYGYDEWLKQYRWYVMYEWSSRGYKNSDPLQEHNAMAPLPNWLDDIHYHHSHKLVLCRKAHEADCVRQKPIDPEYDYRHTWPRLTYKMYKDARYIWPVSDKYKEAFPEKFENEKV